MNNTTHAATRPTASDRFTLTLLRWAPWLAFVLLALPAPLYFLLRYFNSGADAGEWMLAALTSFGVGAVVGLLVALLLVFYRRARVRRVREGLAADGVTVAELPWFAAELTGEERRVLRQLTEARQPLLADAYRETLAARLTATHLQARAGRDARAVEERLRRAAQLPTVERTALETELREDQTRLAQTAREADERRAQAEARLQMIAATASRDAGADATRLALERLQLTQAQTPYALTAARQEHEARAQLEQELKQANAERGMQNDER